TKRTRRCETGAMDWGPGYREQQPPAGLLPSVACLWARVAGPGAGAVADVLPDACVDLIWERGRGLFVAGPDTGPAPSVSPPGTGPGCCVTRAPGRRASPAGWRSASASCGGAARPRSATDPRRCAGCCGSAGSCPGPTPGPQVPTWPPPRPNGATPTRHTSPGNACASRG